MQSTKNWTLPWLAAFLGFPPGGALAVALIGHLDTPSEGIIGGAAAGAVIGAVHTLALRRRLPISWEWIAATTGGLAAGVGLSIALFGAETTLNATLTRAPITGLMVGIAQWLVLRQYTRYAMWWIPAITVVYAVAWYITALVIGDSLNEGFVIFGASGALVHQALMGLVLWVMLRESQSKTAS